MLHVKPPSAATAAPPAFDPIAYVAHCREFGVIPSAREIDGVRSVAFDIGNIRPGDDNNDPRLCIASDPNAMRKVWEVLRAEAWIAAARDCGLVVAPWLGLKGEGGVLECGKNEDDVRNDFSAGRTRFARHPAYRLADDLRKGVVFEVLCAELGVEPDDPELCTKVNAIMRARMS